MQLQLLYNGIEAACPPMAVPATSDNTLHCELVTRLGDGELVSAVGMWESIHVPRALGQHCRTLIS